MDHRSWKINNVECFVGCWKWLQFSRNDSWSTKDYNINSNFIKPEMHLQKKQQYLHTNHSKRQPV